MTKAKITILSYYRAFPSRIDGPDTRRPTVIGPTLLWPQYPSAQEVHQCAGESHSSQLSLSPWL